MAKDIALVIPVYGRWAVTKVCLDSLFQHADENPPFDVIVIDDGSADDTNEKLKNYAVELLVNEENKGYIYSTNRGIRYALDTLESEYVVLMNNDLEFRGSWLMDLLDVVERYDIAGYFGRSKLNRKSHTETSYVEFSCVLIKRDVLLKVGMIDPIYRSGYSSDDDYCLRALVAGYRIGQINKGMPPKVTHFHGQTFGAEQRYLRMKEEFQTFMDRWSPQRDNPVVNAYFKRYVYNPVTRIYGEPSRLRRLIRKYLLRRG